MRRSDQLLSLSAEVAGDRYSHEPADYLTADKIFEPRSATIVSTSADEPRLICGNGGGPLQRVGQGASQCVACFLELAWDDEVAPTASPEHFDHYQVATHTDGAAVELGRGAMGITFKAF